MRSKGLTRNQRVALEAYEGAKASGVPLSEYARSRGLAVRQVYDAIVCLRRRGVVPGRATRRSSSAGQFVALRVARPSVPVREGRGMVCRLLHAGGFALECGEWPDAAWLRAVLTGRGDAAS
jgi:hypothetical protein